MSFRNLLGVGSLATGLLLAAPVAAQSSQGQQQQQQGAKQDTKQASKQASKQDAKQAQQQQEPLDALDPQVMQQARMAFADITKAQRQLESKDAKEQEQARKLLEQAEKSLDKLASVMPGRQLMEKLEQTQGQLSGQGGGVDYAPLMAQVRQHSVYMDPQVAAGVEKSEQAFRKGDKQQAADQLRMVRQVLVADLALMPVETAQARVLAAQTLLQRNEPQKAARMVGSLPIAFTEVQVGSPMVPVRFNLRAAAAAAEAKDWKAAEVLLDAAAQQLQQLQATADGQLARALDPLADQAGKLQKQVDQGKQPKPQELRNLAQRTHQLPIG